MNNGSRVTSPPTKWIWPFELLDRIGEGGMGVVYRARYVVNNREVAVKMLPSDVSDKTVLARFEREMEVLKNLRHQNIVRCFGGACEDKQRFYAMELIPGGSLEDQLQARGKLSWEQVVEYGQQMCAALDCSHKAGVIHRDVKPSNFLIAPNGSLKLSDFGLATVVAARKITAAGKTAGTLLYMSPEQIRGQDITPASDIYALGCVFYELLTGRPPFVGDSPAATLHMHCKAEIPRASQIAFDCPPALDALAQRMMSKEPSQRPASASAVAEELSRITPTITVVQTKRPGSRVSQRPTTVEEREPQQTYTPPAIVVDAPLWRQVATALGVILALSLIGNLVQGRSGADLHQWENAWQSLMTAPEAHTRVTAVSALGAMEGNGQRRVDLLRPRLADSDPLVRAATVQALAQTGPAARSAMMDLMRLQKEDTSSEVRNAATAAVTTIRALPGSGMWFTVLVILSLLTAAAIGVWVWLKRTGSLSAPPLPRSSLTM